MRTPRYHFLGQMGWIGSAVNFAFMSYDENNEKGKNQQLPLTLESRIIIRVRLLILRVFSRDCVLIKGGYVY